RRCGAVGAHNGTRRAPLHYGSAPSLTLFPRSSGTYPGSAGGCVLDGRADPRLVSQSNRRSIATLVREDPFIGWFEALQQRHLKNLTFSEVRRAVQALSSRYIERRGRLDRHSPLDGAGKRAAVAMVFAPLHFLLVRHIVRDRK